MKQKLSSREIVGIILWWAEGSKSRRDKRWKNARTYPVEITNTDSKIIILFLDFLRYDFNINEDKVRLQLQIHEGDNQLELEEYWSKLTKIPKENFNKTIIRPMGNKVGKSQGTCKIRFANKTVYKKLEELQKKVLADVDKHPKQAIKTLPD